MFRFRSSLPSTAPKHETTPKVTTRDVSPVAGQAPTASTDALPWAASAPGLTREPGLPRIVVANRDRTEAAGAAADARFAPRCGGDRGRGGVGRGELERMIEPGIFETVFPRSTLGATFDAVAEHGVHWLQFDFASAGLPALPTRIPDGLAEHIGREASKRGIRLAAVSGTWNMIHPDPRVRAEGLASLRTIAAACRGMGAPVITLCTGTRNPESMWRWHPDNATPAAWQDLVAAMTAALAIADEYDLLLAIEPEPANVAANATLARALIDELAHPRLKIVLDPANIVASDRERPPAAVLDEAFALLGDRIVVAHAKDLDAEGRFCAAGRGIVPWPRVVELLRGAGFAGPLILHSLTEDDADRAIAFIREQIAGAPA